MKTSKFLKLVAALLLVTVLLASLAARGAAGVPSPSDAEASAYPPASPLADDTDPPTVPTGLRATAASNSQINLTWRASTDNTGVTGYKIYRNNAEVGTSVTNSYTDTGLNATTMYTYTVAASDAAGNVSTQSSALPIILAASCDYSDVAASVAAASPGATVLVGPGTAEWTQMLEINKPLSIIGSGNSELTTSAEMPDGLFDIIGFTADTLVRISGFVFEATNDWASHTAIQVRGLTSGYKSNKIRIDHNTFKSFGLPIFFLHPVGLIDNNYFYNAGIAISISAGNRDYADASWNTLDAGTDNAIFIEDNHFISNENYPGDRTDEQVGSMQGSKLVVRYNDFDGDNSALDASHTYTPIMTHGNQGWEASACYWQADDATTRENRRGQPVVEIYNNTMHAKRIDEFFNARGSSNLVYDNSILGILTQNPSIRLGEEEYWSSIFTIHRTAWPAEDQVFNTFIWNNTYRGHDFNDGTYGTVWSSPNSFEAGLWEGRDYFLHEPQPTGGKEIFTGRNGASNTYPTDGDTYPTLGTMIFEPSGPNAYYPYISYVYPHPLTLNDYPGQRALDLAAQTTATQMTLRWKAVDGAVRYEILRNWQQPPTSVTATTYIEALPTTVDNGYMVYALDKDGEILSAEGVKVGPNVGPNEEGVYLPIIQK